MNKHNNQPNKDSANEISSHPNAIYLKNLHRIQSEIKELCLLNGRKENACKLLPVTKTISTNIIEYLCKNKEFLFGENKIQELKMKYETLKPEGALWQFIGHLQTNKVKDCIRFSEMIHSVDRIQLGQALDKELQRQGRSMEILVQVNTSGETSKFGVQPEEALELVNKLRMFETLKIKGLMTLAIFSEDVGKVRSCFRKLKEISEQILCEAPNHVEMKELSMGMSSDYKIAIEEGSTIVRVGQSIFGPRSTPNSYYWHEG